MIVLRGKAEKSEDKYTTVSAYGKRRLLTYADSFRELARSFEGDFDCAGEDRQTLLEARRLWESRQVLCENLNEMAHIMTKIAAEVFRYQPVEEKKHKLIVNAMKSEGIYITDLFYIEQTDARKAVGITMYTDQDNVITSKDVADMLSVLMNQRLEVSVASPHLLDRTGRNYVFVNEARFVILTGFARAVEENETISGDNYSIIESERGKTTVLLSDGMGSGQNACQASEKVLDLMEKMLEADYNLDTAATLVNSALLAQGEERNQATLDVCSLDLYNGTGEFLKIGAAATFIKRGTAVEQISSHNLPLGIFAAVETEVIRRDLADNDYVIMMSDGVLDALAASNYEETMCQMIAGMEEQNPKEIAEKLLQFVLHCSCGRIQDDMTIMVIGLWENN